MCGWGGGGGDEGFVCSSSPAMLFTGGTSRVGIDLGGAFSDFWALSAD